MSFSRECVAGKIRKRGIKLPVQEGEFHCPFQGIEHTIEMTRIASVRSDDYPAKLMVENEGMGRVAALRATLKLRSTINEMAENVFRTNESYTNFFNHLDESSCLVMCVLCQQMAKVGEVAALWRSSDGDPSAAWPAPSRQRNAVPLNSSSLVEGD